MDNLPLLTNNEDPTDPFCYVEGENGTVAYAPAATQLRFISPCGETLLAPPKVASAAGTIYRVFGAADGLRLFLNRWYTELPEMAWPAPVA